MCVAPCEGLDKSTPPAPSGALYQLRMSGEEWRWSTPHVTGELPPARWKHSAALWDKTKMILCSGYANNSCRHSDVWVFNTLTMAWSKPMPSGFLFDSDGNHIVNPKGDPNTPPPRAAHTASIIRDIMFVFGGYGGTGFARRDLNDLYGLSLDDMKWQRLAPKGKPPEVWAAVCSSLAPLPLAMKCAAVALVQARSGHTACVVEATIIVYGGWSSHAQFRVRCPHVAACFPGVPHSPSCCPHTGHPRS